MRSRQGYSLPLSSVRMGNSITDPQFKANWKNSAGLLPRGAYHFFRTNLDPIQQAKLFITTIESLDMKGWGELPMVVDVEDKGTVKERI